MRRQCTTPSRILLKEDRISSAGLRVAECHIQGGRRKQHLLPTAVSPINREIRRLRAVIEHGGSGEGEDGLLCRRFVAGPVQAFIGKCFDVDCLPGERVEASIELRELSGGQCLETSRAYRRIGWH